MRSIFALILMTVSLAFSTAFSQEAADLEHNMKQAGTLFKAIGATVNDPAKNAENAEKAAQMVGFFKLALQQTPEHIHEIPAAQQAEAIKGYQEMLQKVVERVLALQQAFLSNDNAQAAALYQELKDLKHEGHDRFDP